VSGRRTPLVLAADDDQHILELVRFAVEQEGCEVVTAGDGEEALRLARERRPDLCVLDAMMPGLDGFEVARHLADDSETAGIPILLLTAKEKDEVAAKGFSVGAAEYLQKPFSPAALRARVTAVLASE
jgi:two-component system, OmpR family, alkaline phosphatase synthesis response regulator PhoP